MFIGRRFGVVLGVLLYAGVCVAQQAASSGEAPRQAGGGASANRISLSVVVTPQHGGTPVSGLTQQDFTVLDNGAPQTITGFRAFNDGDAPVEVIVVVDAVNAFYQTVSFERGQIEKFLKANGGKLAYPTALAVFTDTGTQIQQGFSTDGNVLSGVLDKYVVGLRSLRRSAGIYGAAEQTQMSVRMLSQLTAREAGRPGRKIVLWVSPGWPILTGPHIYISSGQQKRIFSTIIDMSTAMRKAGITLYGIDPLGTNDIGMRTYYYQNFLKGIRKPEQADYADLSLQVLATQSGGLVLNSSNDVTAQLQKAVQDVSPYYVVSFEGKGEPNEYHQLEVKVAKPGLVARTRTGYYSR